MFSDIIVNLLKKNNITAYKLSKDLGISEALISNWKSGRQEPKYDSLQKLSRYFNVSADYLLELDITNQNIIAPKKNITNYDEVDEQEQKLVANYKKLNIQAQHALVDYSDFMLSKPENLKEAVDTDQMIS